MRTLIFLAFMSLSVLTGAQKNSNFNPEAQPTAPDYGKEKYWAALPFRKDAADEIPSNEQWIDDSLKKADVFFIYPTVYVKGKTWNENVDNEKQNKLVDEKPIKYQASVFNASCRVYAPRYRQARLNSFSDKEIGPKALDFAYADVKRAFEYYLKNYNHGRPIIIASHSQGSYHARRLLKEFFDSTGLKKQLVAAYVVGFGLDEKMFKDLRPCDNAIQTGCYITWASFKTGYEPGSSPLYGTVCVNPVSWTRDTVLVDRSKSIGSLMLDFNKEYPNVCATQIHQNFLWVNVDVPLIRSFKNLHIADYNLFWFDIRKNVKDRIDAFLKSK